VFTKKAIKIAYQNISVITVIKSYKYFYDLGGLGSFNSLLYSMGMLD
jgi:hypothetical protein